MTIFGERLSLLRRQQRLTQEDLGAKVGLAGNTIARVERGLTLTLQSDKVVRLAQVLGTSTDYLLGCADLGVCPADPSQLPRRIRYSSRA